MQRKTSIIMAEPGKDNPSVKHPWNILEQTKTLKNFFKNVILNTIVVIPEKVWDAITEKEIFENSIVAIISTANEVDGQDEHEVSKIGSSLKEVLIWAKNSHSYAPVIILGTVEDISEFQNHCKSVQIIWTNGLSDNYSSIVESLYEGEGTELSETEYVFKIREYSTKEIVSVSGYRDQEAEELGY